MTDDHETWGETAGAYVLGALEAEERSAFEEHLRSCERCAAEVVDLAPLPALLGRVSPDELDQDVGSGLVDLVTAVQAGVDRLERSRRRWMAFAVAAVVVLAAGIAGLVASGGDGGDATVDLADRGVPLVVSAPTGVEAEVVADPRSWGTYVHLAVDGLPPRDRYELWVVDRSGSWHHAGSWGPNEARDARLGASSHVAIDDIEQVVVTSTVRGDQLLSAGPPESSGPSDQSSRE